MRIGVLVSRIRVEEKLIFAAAERLGAEVLRSRDRGLVFDLHSPALP